jgi:hypothetical protein
MAFTVSANKSVFGNKLVHICTVTADAASGTVPTGMTAVEGWTLGPLSMATSAIKIAASAGTVTISNAASGDAFYLTIFGR